MLYIDEATEAARKLAEVVTEVDTKQSDFKSGNYKTMADTLKNPPMTGVPNMGTTRIPKVK